MSTIVLSVNTRSAYGDPAKEALVGVYQIKDATAFGNAVTGVSQAIEKEGWVGPNDRPAAVREALRRKGYAPIAVETVFVPIF